MKYFVTGASGFIGQHLVRQLLRTKGCLVYCLVRDEKKMPDDLRHSTKILKGDGSALGQYAEKIQSCDIIFHVGGKATLGDGDGYKRDNIEFTDSLISICEKSKKLKRFVFTSTVGAVDRSKFDPCDAPLTESAVPNPMSDYGKSKLVCEQHLEASNLPYVIVRPVLVYGPGMRRQSHLRTFIDAVEKGSAYSRFNFPGTLSFIHVNDLVGALILLARHPGAVRQTYFASDSIPLPLGALFRELGDILGRKTGTVTLGIGIPWLFRAIRRFLPFQAQNLFSDVLTVSNNKLRALGFIPKVDSQQGFLDTAHDHFRREHPERRTAIVTGGASGIGKSLCRQLYAHGYEIVIVDRDELLGRDVAESVHGAFVNADLGKESDVHRVERFIREHADHIDLLVNNAGIGKRGNTEEIPSPDLISVVAINCSAPIALTNAILPVLIKRGYGTIVNIGSSAGYQPLPYMSVYAASKAFIIRYTEALQGELMGRDVPDGVEVILASPSGTATKFQKNSGVKDNESKLLRPEEVAAAIVRKIGKGHARFIVGSSGKGMAFAARFLPERMQIRLWEQLMRTKR